VCPLLLALLNEILGNRDQTPSKGILTPFPSESERLTDSDERIGSLLKHLFVGLTASISSV
jgi:hypothetical protein